MPKANVNTGPAPATGANIRKREPKQGTVCGRTGNIQKRPDRKKKDGNTPIAGSIFALTPKPIDGLDIYFSDRRKRDKFPEDHVKMFHDLWKCYQRLRMALYGEDLKINMVDLGIPIHTAFAHMIREVQRMLPVGCSLNIDKDYSRKGNIKTYYFTWYYECETLDMLSRIEVFPIMKALRRNKQLTLQFVRFLQCVRKHIGVDAWWEGCMEMVPEWIEEEIMNAEEDYDRLAEEDSKIHKDLCDCRAKYNYGTAYLLQKMIVSQRDLADPQVIISDLDFYRFRHPVAKAIRMGCEFMLIEKGNLMELVGYETDERNTGIGLPADFTFCIIYDEGDTYTDKYREYVDSLANEGQHPPVAKLRIKPEDDEEIDVDHFKNMFRYAERLKKLFADMNKIFHKYE